GSVSKRSSPMRWSSRQSKGKLQCSENHARTTRHSFAKRKSFWPTIPPFSKNLQSSPAARLRRDERDRIGERIGAYAVISEFGRGGMGAVYLAERADGQFEK